MEKTTKNMGLWSAISKGVGGMIGAGIFSIMGIACQIAGNAVYLSFILAGIVALFCTYSYGKLGETYPSSGGPVEFLIKGFGTGITSGGFNLLLWIGYVFALALYAKAFASYAVTFLPAQYGGIWVNILATASIVLFTAVNFIGAKAVGRSEIVIVIIKVVILLAFAGLGFAFMDPSRLAVAKWPTTGNILFGAGVVFIGFEGFGLITNAAGDMEDPRRTLPMALYLSVLIVTGVYVAVSMVVVGNLDIPEIIKSREFALAQAAKPFLGVIGFKIMAIAALFSTSSAINATLYGGANVSYMVAREGELPEMFDRKVWGRAIEGLFITAAVVIFVTNTMNLEGIAMMGSALFLVIYTAVNIGHLRLCTATGANRAMIWVSIVSCVAALITLGYYIIQSSPTTLMALLIAIILCFAFEWAYRRISGRTLSQSTSPHSRQVR